MTRMLTRDVALEAICNNLTYDGTLLDAIQNQKAYCSRRHQMIYVRTAWLKVWVKDLRLDVVAEASEYRKMLYGMGFRLAKTQTKVGCTTILKLPLNRFFKMCPRKVAVAYKTDNMQPDELGKLLDEVAKEPLYHKGIEEANKPKNDGTVRITIDD